MDMTPDEHLIFQTAFCPIEDIQQLLNNSYDSLQELLQYTDSNPHLAGSHTPNESGSRNIYQEIEDVLHTKVVVAVSVIGLIGNILNLWILTQKSLQNAMGRMEKFAHTGLISLAASDMLFCLMIIPYSFVPLHQISYTHSSFNMFYNLYSFAIINTLILSSSILTVVMAAGRYFAIVHPLHARQFIGMTCAKRATVLVFLACIAFNIPRFWRFKLVPVKCSDDRIIYVRQDGHYKHFEMAYLCVYLVLGVVIPFLVLAYCNMVLLRTLRQSNKQVTRFRRNEVQHETRNRVTLTLVVIVIFYLILVTPAEAINLSRQVFGFIHIGLSLDQFNVAVAAVNVLQAVNFSFNFILYCVINTHFRKVLKNAMRCKWDVLFDDKRRTRESSFNDSVMGSSMRSTGHTFMRTYVYNGRVLNGKCKLQEETQIGTELVPCSHNTGRSMSSCHLSHKCHISNEKHLGTAL